MREIYLSKVHLVNCHVKTFNTLKTRKMNNLNIYSLSDEELINKIKSGETLLFEVVIRRYNQLLYKIARSYGFNHEDSEDIIQDTHVSAYSALKGFRMESSYKTWITKILIHKCSYKVNYCHLNNVVPYADVTLKDSNILNTTSNQQETEKVVVHKELTKMIEQGLQQVPVIYRNVFVLRVIEGFSVAETSEQLNITPANVKVRLNRAKLLLKKQLEKYYTVKDIYEFNLIYCDNIVHHVFEKIKSVKRD